MPREESALSEAIAERRDDDDGHERRISRGPR